MAIEKQIIEYMKTLSLIIVTAFLIISGCTSNESKVKTIVISQNSLGEEAIVADPIIYAVDIISYDQDDEWMNERLKHVQSKKIITEIFEQVYGGQLEAFDYYTDQLLTLDDVKRIESAPDYSRGRIEELLFEETWLFSAEQKAFQKHVHSMVLGYAVYADDGYRRGVKPVFRVKLN